MQAKTMNLLCRSRRLLSSVSRRSVLLKRTEAFESVSSTPRARCLSLSLPQQFTASPPSCQRWRQASSFSSYFDKRCYSESEKSRNSESSGVTEGSSHELDDNSGVTEGSSHKLDDNSGVTEGSSHELDDNSGEKSSLSQRSLETFSLDVLVSLLRQENAVDLCVIKVPEHIKYAEYFIVVSGVSPRHLRAMALYAIKVYKFLKKDRDPNVKIEGKDAEDWMCIDFGNMVIHFMLPETREVYELEKLWTLRRYDEQLKSIPTETLPEDFIFDVDVTK